MAPNIGEVSVLSFLEKPLPWEVCVPNLFGFRFFIRNVVVILTSASRQFVFGPTNTLIFLPCGLAVGSSLLAFALPNTSGPWASLPAAIIQLPAFLGWNPEIVAPVRAQLIPVSDVGRRELLLGV